ncbi:MAG: ATP-grasp domain-containing protein [Firmicutes bacterium]|nr:ATP-grasp domain-containing protein [Bacillota bacterium]
MKTGWLLYDACDYAQNRMFVSHIQQKGQAVGLALAPVLTGTLETRSDDLPDFVISRQRYPKISEAFERHNIPVFNSSRVSEICNDKRNTHRFLQGLPQMKTACIDDIQPYIPNSVPFPAVVKPALGHGGDRVTLVKNEKDLRNALSATLPQPALVQELASEAGKDLRVYVLFGRIVAAVLRTAREGIVSNFKRGGSVELHTLTGAEEALARMVMKRFEECGAPLSFAGIDFLYHNGEPVINEVEDVVGSRMLYKVSSIDVIALYIGEIAKRL